MENKNKMELFKVLKAALIEVTVPSLNPDNSEDLREVLERVEKNMEDSLLKT